MRFFSKKTGIGKDFQILFRFTPHLCSRKRKNSINPKMIEI